MARGVNDSDTHLKAIPFKICIIGNSSVGKTCLVNRYINNTFAVQQNTLAAALMDKVEVVEPPGVQRTKVKLQIWDTAGAEEYRSINSLYYKKAAVVCLVYSVTDYESFDALKYWVNEIEMNGEPGTIKFVVGAKIDDNDVEEGEAVPKHVAQEYAATIGAKFFLTSAKENIGINKMFQTAAEMCASQANLRNDRDVSVQQLQAWLASSMYSPTIGWNYYRCSRICKIRRRAEAIETEVKVSDQTHLFTKVAQIKALTKLLMIRPSKRRKAAVESLYNKIHLDIARAM